MISCIIASSIGFFCVSFLVFILLLFSVSLELVWFFGFYSACKIDHVVYALHTSKSQWSNAMQKMMKVCEMKNNERQCRKYGAKWLFIWIFNETASQKAEWSTIQAERIFRSIFGKKIDTLTKRRASERLRATEKATENLFTWNIQI